MAKIVTLGEIMLRLTSPFNKRFVQSDSFDVCYAGAEANVAVSLANFGMEAEFVTKVPDSPIGECAVAAVRKYNVITSNIAKGGERLGLYYLEMGSSLRSSNVIYDRANSSISQADTKDFDFDRIFENCSWFHFTGITPALSDKAAKLVEDALICAKKHSIYVSADINYRKKLWSTDKACRVMTPLMKYVDVCIAGPDDAEKILGVKVPREFNAQNGTDSVNYAAMSANLCDKYGFKYVASTMRESYSASDNGWSACIYSDKDKELYHSKQYRIFPIVDRVGGGDSFAAGLICGFSDGKDFKSALEFGVAASALKLTVPGDYNIVSKSEVESLLSGNLSGTVQR